HIIITITCNPFSLAKQTIQLPLRRLHAFTEASFRQFAIQFAGKGDGFVGILSEFGPFSHGNQGNTAETALPSAYLVTVGVLPGNTPGYIIQYEKIQRLFAEMGGIFQDLSGGYIVFRFFPPSGKPTAFPGLRCGGSGRISIRYWISRIVPGGVRDYRWHVRSHAGPVETVQRRWETGIRKTVWPRIPSEGIKSQSIVEVRRTIEPRSIPGRNISLGQLALDDFPDLFLHGRLDEAFSIRDGHVQETGEERPDGNDDDIFHRRGTLVVPATASAPTFPIF